MVLHTQSGDPLEPVRRHAASAEELRVAIAATRQRLLDVLHARVHAATGVSRWHGPHREQFDLDTADLLEAGRTLDASLAGLLTALDAETAVRET